VSAYDAKTFWARWSSSRRRPAKTKSENKAVVSESDVEASFSPR